MSVARKTLRIVAADDSGVIRHMLSMLFDSVAEHADGSEPKMELAATVADGVHCLDTVRNLQPDLLLLDLEMPRMGGLEVLDILRRERPDMPIIMCSAYTARGAAATLDALARGAADYVTKPSGSRDPLSAMASLSAQLLPKIAAFAERAGRNTRTAPPAKLGGSTTLNVASARRGTPAEIVGIGVSTGGPAALEQLLPQLPGTFSAPIVIVQHMPKLFTSVLAQRLSTMCSMPVREAQHGNELLPGTIWLAPGDSHMEVARSTYGPGRVVLHQGPPEHHCRPAVDVLFRSLARVYRDTALGMVLTGMGSDGLAGARDMVRAGGKILAQDEASSAVWGMPGRIAEAGLAAAVLPLSALAGELIGRVRSEAPSRDTKWAREETSYAMQ